MKELVNRLVSFDRMIGASLVKLLYFLGLAPILLGALIGTLKGVDVLFDDFGAGLLSVAFALGSGFLAVCL